MLFGHERCTRAVFLCFSFALQYQREGKFDTSSEDDSSAKSSGEDERAAKVEESDGDEPKKTK